MNENINIAPQESKLIIYLVVAAKVIVYMLLMLGFAGVLGAVCIKAVSFFKIDGKKLSCKVVFWRELSWQLGCC